MLRFVSIAFAALALAAAAGCRGFDIAQTCIFADEDGNVVTVGYGSAEKPHTNTYVNPFTKQEMEFKSNLGVEVELPDGDSFVAWRCMNFERSGTMYRTDNGRWMFHANGFTSSIYERRPDGGYNQVFNGVLCEAPKSDHSGDDKWRKMKKDAKGKWR